MSNRLLLFILLMAVAFISIFLFGYKHNGLQKFTANLLDTMNLQKNAASSTNATSSLENNASSTSMPTLTDVLRELQSQEQLLANQVTDLRSKLEVANLQILFVRIMKRGDSGDDVSKLQELLRKIPGVYPPETDSSSTISGYYGPLTETAVKKFQEKNDLKQTGVVNQDTKKKFYELAASLVVDENTLTEFDQTDLSTVADLQNLIYLQNQISQASNTQINLTDLKDQIYQLTTNSSSTQASIADLQNQISQITSEMSNIQSSIAVLNPPAPSIPSSPAPTPTSTSTPSLLAITNIQALNITKTSSTITWATNNPSTSEVDYSQSSSTPINQMLTASSNVMVTNHRLTLLGLNASTIYYYRVVSKDSTNAVASSTNLSFKTLN